MADIPAAKSAPPFSSRDRLLAAAKHLFAHNGYENTSTVTIAREAGTSESQLMKHFGNKQGLLVAILERGWETIAQRVRATQRGGPPADQLVRVLEALVIELENDADLKEIMMLESRRVRKDNRDVLMTRGLYQFSETVQGILSEMRGQRELRSDVNVDAVRAAVIGMAEAMVREQVVARRTGLKTSYRFDDIRKVLETMVFALNGEAVQG